MDLFDALDEGGGCAYQRVGGTTRVLVVRRAPEPPMRYRVRLPHHQVPEREFTALEDLLEDVRQWGADPWQWHPLYSEEFLNDG